MTEAGTQTQMSHAPGSFCWIELATTDGPGAKKFYSELFGWEAEDSPVGPDMVYTMLRLNGKDVGALFEKGERMKDMPTYWASYISVASELGLAAAEAAVQTAARLRPDAGEMHLARARNLYWGHSDYDGALAELEIARQRLPSDNWVFSLKGYIERRQGRWEESLRDLERAIALDPRNILTLQQTARSYSLLHRYAESKALLARVLSFEPNDPVTKVLHAFVELDANANARSVLEVIDAIRRTNPAALPNVANNWLICALAQRDIAAAKQALAACGENPILLGSNENVIFPRSFAEGVIARMNQDDDKVRAAFAAAHAEQEKIVQAQANYGPALCVLGLIDAGLGRKEQALREGRRAVLRRKRLLNPTRSSLISVGERV